MLDEQLPETGSPATNPARQGRRLPAPLTPELLQLCRREDRPAAHPLIGDDFGGRDRDELRPFTGVLVAVGLSVLIWITITGLLYYVI